MSSFTRITKSNFQALITAYVVVFLVATTALPLQAAIIAENEITGVSGTVAATGQSVHTPVGPTWDNITFSFGLNNSGDSTYVPIAGGTLYLLGQEYLSPADDLSPVTSGYIASTALIQDVGTGKEWVFDAALTLLPDTDYWFYMDRQTNETIPFMGVVHFTSNTYSGGAFYLSGPSSADYVLDTGDTAFRLNGNAVPEPTSSLLLLAGLGVVTWRRGKRSRLP